MSDLFETKVPLGWILIALAAMGSPGIASLTIDARENTAIQALERRIEILEQKIEDLKVIDRQP